MRANMPLEVLASSVLSQESALKLIEPINQALQLVSEVLQIKYSWIVRKKRLTCGAPTR